MEIIFNIFNKINPFGYKIMKVRIIHEFDFTECSITIMNKEFPVGGGVMTKTSYKHKLTRI